MIKLFSLKQQKKDGEPTAKPGIQKKASAAQLRITKGKIICLYLCRYYYRLWKNLMFFFQTLTNWIYQKHVIQNFLTPMIYYNLN